MKKYILLSIFAGALLVLPSCSKDYLTLNDPNRQSADTYWTTESDFDKALNAAYSCFRLPGYFGRWYHAVSLLRGDEAWSHSPAPHWIAIANFKTTSYSGTEGVVEPWKMIYRQIYYCNQIFDYMDLKGAEVFKDAEVSKRIVGQAYFLRGFAYWYLATTYGRGPIQPNSVDNGPIGEQEDIYKQAVSDFAEAEKRLPASWSGINGEEGRVTLGAASAMMAKVYMQLAGYYKRPNIKDVAKATENWTKAKAKLEEILKMNYTLVPNYKSNFTEADELNSESIFEVIFRDEIYNGKEVGSQRGKFIGFPVGGIGAWHDVSARPWLLDEFQKEKTIEGKVDPRLDATLIYQIAGDTTKYYGKTWSEWDAAATTPEDKLTEKCYWKKYTNAEYKASEDYKNGINFRVIRLSDVYLMYAEVINELNGDRSVAVEYINKVRRRAKMADLSAAGFPDYASLLTQIKHERLVELCGECTRWTDLDRWGDLFDQQSVNQIALDRDADFNTFTVGSSHKYIIPQSDISLCPGLIQNPGY